MRIKEASDFDSKLIRYNNLSKTYWSIIEDGEIDDELLGKECEVIEEFIDHWWVSIGGSELAVPIWCLEFDK